MQEKKGLSKKELCDLFPYLKEELEHGTSAFETEDCGRSAGITEYSTLESAVLITTDKKTGFPNPFIDIDEEEQNKYKKERQVDLASKKGKLRRTVVGAWRQDKDFGEKTDAVLKRMWIKPAYVIVKEINTHEKHEPVHEEKHLYNIKVYKIR